MITLMYTDNFTDVAVKAVDEALSTKTQRPFVYMGKKDSSKFFSYIRTHLKSIGRSLEYLERFKVHEVKKNHFYDWINTQEPLTVNPTFTGVIWDFENFDPIDERIMFRLNELGFRVILVRPVPRTTESEVTDFSSVFK